MSKESTRIDTIMNLLSKFPKPSIPFDIPIGAPERDDCAVLSICNDTDLVIGSDFVRGEGFYLYKKGLMTKRDIGRYLVVANVSDLAAMGSTPVGIVVVLRYTSSMSDDEFEEIMRGVVEACSEFNVPLLGGDTGGYESSVLSAAAIGTVPRGKALLRSRGMPGDAVYVSGNIGTAGAAIGYFLRPNAGKALLTNDMQQCLLNAWTNNSPAVAQGQFLVSMGYSRCAIDTSDGLKAACRQIAEASQVDVVLEPQSLPIDTATRKVAESLGIDLVALAVSDSVDFRLVFTVSNELVTGFEKDYAKQGWPVHRIGHLTLPKASPQVYAQGDQSVEPLPGIEWSQADDMTIDLLRAQATRP